MKKNIIVLLILALAVPAIALILSLACPAWAQIRDPRKEGWIDVEEIRQRKAKQRQETGSHLGATVPRDQRSKKYRPKTTYTAPDGTVYSRSGNGYISTVTGTYYPMDGFGKPLDPQTGQVPQARQPFIDQHGTIFVPSGSEYFDNTTGRSYRIGPNGRPVDPTTGMEIR